MNEESTRKCMR